MIKIIKSNDQWSFWKVTKNQWVEGECVELWVYLTAVTSLECS